MAKTVAQQVVSTPPTWASHYHGVAPSPGRSTSSLAPAKAPWKKADDPTVWNPETHVGDEYGV